MKNIFLLLMLVVGSLLQAQVKPIVEVGGSLNGDGYSPVSAFGSAGVSIDSNHFLSTSRVDYDTARKVNDGETHNEKGHVISGSTEGYLRLGILLVGGNIEWTKTITSDYTKEATYPGIGGGVDTSRFTLVALYRKSFNELTHYPTIATFTAPDGKSSYKSESCNCSNGVNDAYIQFWYPSLRVRRHLFFHAQVNVDWYHGTLTDPNYAYLTRQQEAVKGFGGTLRYGVMYRF